MRSRDREEKDADLSNQLIMIKTTRLTSSSQILDLKIVNPVPREAAQRNFPSSLCSHLINIFTRTSSFHVALIWVSTLQTHPGLPHPQWTFDSWLTRAGITDPSVCICIKNAAKIPAVAAFINGHELLTERPSASAARLARESRNQLIVKTYH